MAELPKVYYYRVVLKAGPNFEDYLIDKYELRGVELWKGLAETLEIYMTTYAARRTYGNGTSAGFYRNSARYYSIYLDMGKLGDRTLDSRLDDIDNEIKDSIARSISSYDRTPIPKPPLIEIKRTAGSTYEDTNDISYQSAGASEVTITFNGIPIKPEESYIADTTPFRKRGLVKIQGADQYKEAGQVLGKDLTTNPTTVASDNQTHLNASETDEQVENSIAVSIWYFKNKTTGNINTIELKSKIPKDKYVEEYQRIKSILG